MKINEALILKLQKLSRLSLSEEEQRIIKNDLEGILGMVEKLQSLDTQEIEPLKYLTKTKHSARKDQVFMQDVKEKALDLSPKRTGGYFSIPKVISKNKR